LRIRIANKSVGPEDPCFIIAEAGVNHNGDINLAKKLIDIASGAEVDAVKFQTFKAEDLVQRDLKLVTYQKENIRRDETQYDMLKRLELSLDDFRELKSYCDKKGIIFLSTLHTNDDILEFMDNLLPAFKVGSGDLTNHIFLEKLAKKKKPILLGTGMATIEEVIEAQNVIKDNGNDQIIILHATSNYPCPLDEVNLNAIKTMQNKLNCLVGYSDHTEGILVAVLAVAFGAVVIEKHFTLNKNLPGPDHKASLSPTELKNMTEAIRNAESAMGKFDKNPVKSEKELMKFARKSLIAKTFIKKGTVINESMIAIKRPGTGLKPSKFYSIIGKRTIQDIKQDEILQDYMFE